MKLWNNGRKKTGTAKIIKQPAEYGPSHDRVVRFVKYYVGSLDVPGSAKKAGVHSKTAYAWIRIPWVKQLIQDELRKYMKRQEVTNDRIFEEIAIMAFARPEHYDRSGDVVTSEEDPELAGLAMEVSVDETSGGEDGPITRRSVNYKLKDKAAALNLLVRIQGMITEKVEANVTQKSTEELLDIARAALERNASSDE